MKNITDYLEPERVQAVLDYVQVCSSRDYLMLRILWRTGIRVSELLSIRPQNLEPHNQYQYHKGERKQERRVMLDPETLDHLRVHFTA
jgi:integrase